MNNTLPLYGIDFDTLVHIVNSMYDELLIYDDNYKIVFINKACSRHYSCSAEEMIGKSFFDFVNADKWKPSILPIVYKEKKAYAIKQKTFTERELLTIAVPIFDECGAVKYVVMNVRDDVNEIDLYNPQYRSTNYHFENVQIPIAKSTLMQQVVSLIEKISQIDVTCILTGESGTGKTMLAKYLKSISSRKNGPFIHLNCASIPNDLIESELFGYIKGAFTGANPGGKRGLIESANTGTLLLDEVSELSFAAQAKLLHVLQEREFYPVGSAVPVKVDVRIISATNKNLEELVEAKLFREDLYYRLKVVDIHVPPLRNRKEDILPLVYLFLNRTCQKYHRTRQLSEDILAYFFNYKWPGNVRELEHLIERLVVTTDTISIDSSSIPKTLFKTIDDDSFPFTQNGGSLEEKLRSYESFIITGAYAKYKSSRKIAKVLSISQTKANNLIRKYIKV